MHRSHWRERKLHFLAWTFAGMALVLAGCGSTPSAAAPSSAAVVAALSQNQAATAQPSNQSSSQAGQTQRSEGGSVTIDVTWENPKDTTGPLSFSVAMNTHSVELDGIDLAKQAVLRNDQGLEVKPQSWEAPSGGHHRSGLLTFPAKDASSKPILGAGTKTLELVLRDVAGVKERVLRWNVS